MTWCNFFKSSIGAKAVMAASGAGLIGFVIVHMLGNMLIFSGQEALNAYAAQLRSMPMLLLVARGGLIGLFLAHIGSAVRLIVLNRRARPQGYVARASIQQKMATRTIVLSGLVLLAFLIYHLMHFTWGLTHPAHASLLDATGRPDVYSMVVLGFQQPAITGFYIISMILLGMHMSHGAASVFQTIGIQSPRWRALTDRAAPLLGAIIMLGNAAMPLAVLLDLIKLPAGVM